MSDAWKEIQAIKSKRTILREKLEKRRRELEGILNQDSHTSSDGLSVPQSCSPAAEVRSPSDIKDDTLYDREDLKIDKDVEKALLWHLCDVTLPLPVSSQSLTEFVKTQLNRDIPHQFIQNLLQKFFTQHLISVRELGKHDMLEVVNTDHAKILPMVSDVQDDKKRKNPFEDGNRRKTLDSESHGEDEFLDSEASPEKKEIDATDIMSLISMPTIKEKESKKVGEEIMELLSKPTAKERSLAERFRSQGGANVMEFCPHGTKLECVKISKEECKKLHFKKIIQSHTDESLGDCSFLNTCFHMDSCKYVHYEVDVPKGITKEVKSDIVSNIVSGSGNIATVSGSAAERTGSVLYPAQWIQCDLRFLDMSVLGKFAVIMADPPWDIHMELPYGTMSDDEMRHLGIPQLQDDGLIFLWVTGRAMELGRECLKLWGYDRVDELIWVKTNQLQRIIRTGRTGHWLNHGKEHCLVGLKGNPPNLNRGLDCDVIVAEVRATSHKPDEIYGIIERLSPGTRKIELFGRPHNIQPNWITLGNQVDGVRLIDPELIEAFRVTYPDGNCMRPPTTQKAPSSL